MAIKLAKIDVFTVGSRGKLDFCQKFRFFGKIGLSKYSIKCGEVPKVSESILRYFWGFYRFFPENFAISIIGPISHGDLPCKNTIFASLMATQRMWKLTKGIKDSCIKILFLEP